MSVRCLRSDGAIENYTSANDQEESVIQQPDES